MYKIKCKECDCVYLELHWSKTRVKEHAKAIATLDKSSLLANYHQIDLEGVEIVGRSSKTNP